MIGLAETVGPRLVEDGVFLAGLDVVKDKLMEINVFSPGALYGATQITGMNFMEPVIASLEHKAVSANSPGRKLSNRELAVL